MIHSLNEWFKPGKRPMTFSIIDSSPPLNNIFEVKDFLMIFLWDRIKDQVTGDIIEFCKVTDVIASEQKRDFEITLPVAIIDIYLKDPDGVRCSV
jgi:hypothetical protein